MATQERLSQFPPKLTPTSPDIIYMGDASNQFNEVQVTVENFFSSYSLSLASLASLASSANTLPYFSGANTFSSTGLTSFARSILDDIDAPSVLVTIGALAINGGTMTGSLILNADPISSLGAATKQYVDNFASGLKIQIACYAGTTVNLNATYSNGTAGVGATLTNAGTMAAFSIDGVSPSINSRVLVKDQSSTFQNGIYTLTTVGSGSANWVLTRATDFDQTTEIVPGAFVSTTNGSTQSNAGWAQTATVVAIGTDPIIFTQFFSGNLARAGANNDITSMVGLTGDLQAPTGVLDSLSNRLIGWSLAGNTQPNQPSFEAYVSVTSGAVTGDGTDYTVIGYTAYHNIGNNFNPVTGVFTASQDGTHVFYATPVVGSLVANNIRGTMFFKVGGQTRWNDVSNWGNGRTDQNQLSKNGSCIVKLTMGDTVSLHIQEIVNGAKNVTIIGGINNTVFGGFLLG